MYCDSLMQILKRMLSGNAFYKALVLDHINWPSTL